MSANKFKVGDKVKVRKDLIVDEYYDGIYCNKLQACMGGAILTIDFIENDYYVDDEYKRGWTDEMLEPTIEINGKKYIKTDFERAIKDLEPID